MASPEHLAKLKERVEAWNRWRRENPEIVPDLADAMLQGAHLPDLDLRNPILNGAKLGRANLMGADRQ